MRPELKKQLHAARASLAYWKTTDRPVRGISREEGVALAQAEVDRIVALVVAETPEPISLRVQSPYFIGPIRRRGVRGDGPTIVCFRCEHEKPREEFYSKGTVCKACFVKRAGEWAEKNPNKAKEAKSKFAVKNRGEKNKNERESYHLNIDSNRSRSRDYYVNNREKCLKSVKACAKRRRKTDPKYRALLTCKRRMWILFKSAGVKKNLRSAELLGTDRAGFFAHIESLFQPGMTWANRGKFGWHLDHKKPCALFNMTDPKQAKECWNYKNLQPLWWQDNLRKGDSYVQESY